MLTVGSLFSGIGGFDLGFERVGMRVAWQVERDPWARQVLATHWPEVPKYDDVRTVDAATLSRVDLLCGGFPCIDISTAGKQAGITGPHSGLWREFARLVRELRPLYVVVENVANLRRRGLDVVLGDLASSGYDAEWACLPAGVIGAPHWRDRLWCVAYRDWEPVYDLDAFTQCECCDDWWCPRCDCHAGECPCLTEGRCDTPVVSKQWGDVTYPDGQRTQVPAPRIFTAEQVPERDGWWATEPAVHRVVDGVPLRLDRLRGLGNALVPQIASWIGTQILADAQRQEGGVQ